VKNKTNNNNNTVNSTNKFKITFLIAIFGMILMASALTMNIKAVVVYAQDNNSTNSTSSSESDNQTQDLQDLCKLPPQEKIRILHGQHISC
jgi:hypothetical protein